MTIADIRSLKKEILTPSDVADLFGSDPQTIRLTARQKPELIGYPFTFVGSRMKIPRVGFLNWFDGKEKNRATSI